MLGLSTHAWKVNFCKFTNETRNGIEDASRHSGLKFIAALQRHDRRRRLRARARLRRDPPGRRPLVRGEPARGAAARRAARHRRADPRHRQAPRPPRPRRRLLHAGRGRPRAARAGVAADRRLSPSRSSSRTLVRERALALAATSDRPAGERGVALHPAGPYASTSTAIATSTSTCRFDRAARTATRHRASAPAAAGPARSAASSPLGAAWWPLAMARELDDAILLLRTNEPELGTWVLQTARRRRRGAGLRRRRSRGTPRDWFVRETIGMLRRTLARLDVTSRIAVRADRARARASPARCSELALAADRSYMLALPDDPMTARRRARAVRRQLRRRTRW